MSKKYKLTKETIEWKGHTLHRIKALKDISFNAVKGELGGFVESEHNLSQEGTCWIFDNAKVYDNARVLDDARLYENVEVFEEAVMYDSSVGRDDAKIYGSANVENDSIISECAKIYDFAQVSGGCIGGLSEVYGDSTVSGDAFVTGKARIYGWAEVCGQVVISGSAIISGNQYISFGNCDSDLSKDLVESIRCQTGLAVVNNKVIAYALAKTLDGKKMKNYWDSNVIYKIGAFVNAKYCGYLLFTNAAFCNKKEDPTIAIVVAEIDLKDITEVRGSTICCKKAKILGVADR